MRIAMVSPLEMRVPPVAYGGTELAILGVTPNAPSCEIGN